MNREVVVNLFKKVARILEDDKEYEWLADEVKDYLNEIYVNEEAELEQTEQEPKFNFDLERMKAAIESSIADVTVDDLAEKVKQEPVGIVRTIGGYPDNSEHVVDWLCKYKDLKEGDRLYLAPPKQQPLTDEAICDILIKKEWKGFVDLVRIIEKMHGIGGGE